VEEIRLPPDAPPQTVDRAIRSTQLIALIGLLVGSIIILAGIVLLLLGLTSNVELTVAGEGVSAKVQTASVGVVVALIGLAVVWLTRQRVLSE
jgi:hypothetical protein